MTVSLSASAVPSGCGGSEDDMGSGASFLTRGGSLACNGAAIDPQIARLMGAVAELTRASDEAKPGRLGESATGLTGAVDANIAALLDIAARLESLAVLTGARAGAASESWVGLRALLRLAGQPDGRVSALVRCGDVVGQYSDVADAWVAGKLSAAQVCEIGRVAALVPMEDRLDAVTILAEHAPTLTFSELRHAGRVLLNAVVPAREEREADRAKEQSYFSLYPDGAGYGASGWFTVEQAGWIRTVLDAATSVVAHDDVRTFTEGQAAALVDTLRAYAASDVIPTLAMARPRFVVLCTASDLTAIAAGAAPAQLPITLFGDVVDPVTTRRMMSDCEVVPVVADEVSATTIADVALDQATARRCRAWARVFRRRRRSGRDTRNGVGGDDAPVLLRLLTTPVRPLALGRSVRTVPGWLRDAVSLRDVHCVVPGCAVPAHRCEVHHVRPWALGGATDLSNLALLCVRHHRTVERGSWSLRPRTGSDDSGRYWVAVAT